MSSDFIIRLIGMIVFSVLGVYGGVYLGNLANINPTANTLSVEVYAVTVGMVGALAGLILSPFLTTRPLRALRSTLGQISAQKLLAALIGFIAGLIIAALLAFPLSLLPKPFGSILPFIGVLIFGYLGVAVFMMRQNDIFSILSTVTQRSAGSSTTEEKVGFADGRLYSSGHQCDHRWSYRGYCPDRIHSRFIADSTLCTR